MHTLLENFALGLPQLGALAAMLALAAGMISIGAYAAGRGRAAEADLLSGWAILIAVFTVIGVATTLPFTYIALAALVAAVACGVLVVRRDGRLFDVSVARLLVLGAPLLVLVAAMGPSQWDEFSHWLPNARYLVDYDTFPRAGYPAGTSLLPGYPYGLPLATYLASRLAGGLVENGGPMFNLLLLLSFALLIARLIRAGQAGPAVSGYGPGAGKGVPAGASGWTYCALGGLAVTMLSPTFVPKIAFTNYADTGTAVALGFAAVLGWWILNALADGDEAAARRYGWQLSLALTALAGLRDSNTSLIFALICGMVLVALRDRAVPTWRLVRLLAVVLILPIAVWAAWRLHFMYEIAGHHPKAGYHPGVQPMASWRFDTLPLILERMLVAMTRKGGYFGVMLIVLIAAGWALVRMQGAFHRLAIIAATVFLLHNLFLMFTYIAIFGEYEGTRIASYWRYNMHVGGITVVFAAYGLSLLWRHKVRLSPRTAYRAAVIAVILLLPVALSHKVRFDRNPMKVYVRGMAPRIAGAVPEGARLAVVEPLGSGFADRALRYGFNGKVRIVGNVVRRHHMTPERLREFLATAQATHAWVEEPTPAVERGLRAAMAPGSSYLLARGVDGWSVIGSWPHPDDGRSSR